MIPEREEASIFFREKFKTFIIKGNNGCSPLHFDHLMTGEIEVPN